MRDEKTGHRIVALALRNRDAALPCEGGTESETRKKGVNDNQTDTYYFDVEKCKRCPLRQGCYKEGAKSKTYSDSIKSSEHTEQMAFQESEYFKERAKERYKN